MAPFGRFIRLFSSIPPEKSGETAGRFELFSDAKLAGFFAGGRLCRLASSTTRLSFLSYILLPSTQLDAGVRHPDAAGARRRGFVFIYIVVRYISGAADNPYRNACVYLYGRALVPA